MTFLKNEIDLQISNLYDDGKYLWFTAYTFGALYKMNKEVMHPEFVAYFEQEKMTEIRLYSDIISWNKFLIFTPLRAKKIAIFNKLTENISYIEIDIPENDCIKGYSGWNYYSAQLVGDCIYFFPHQRKCILRLDLLSQTIEGISEWTNDILTSYSLKRPRLYSKTRLIGNKVFAPISGTNILQIIDLQNKKTKIIETQDKEACYCDSFVIRDSVYLSPLEGAKIACLNIKTGKQDFFPVHEANPPHIQYIGILRHNNKLLFIPQYHGNITFMDIDTKIISDTNNNELEDKLLYFNDAFMDESKYMCFTQEEKEPFMYCNHKGALIKIGCEEAHTYKIKTILSEDVKKKLMLLKIESGDILREGEIYNLNNYLEYIDTRE